MVECKVSSGRGGVVPRESHKLQASVQFGEGQHCNVLEPTV